MWFLLDISLELDLYLRCYPQVNQLLFIAFSTGFYLTTVNSARTGITVLASSSVLSHALKICLPLPFTHGAWTITLQRRMNLPVSVSKVGAKPSFVNLENFSVEDKCSTYCYLQFFTPVVLKISVVIILLTAIHFLLIICSDIKEQPQADKLVCSHYLFAR